MTLKIGIIALMTDLLAGEPPLHLHPTVRIGDYIKRLSHRAIEGGEGKDGVDGYSRESQRINLLLGSLISASGIAATAVIGTYLSRAIRGHSKLVHAHHVMEGYALKHTLALRALLSAAREVECALRRDNLPEARRLLAWHLVSRDTTNLTQPQVISATIESISENLCDSFIAPLFYYRHAGLGGALAYRFINTADAMLGYRTPQLEWLGKASALIDDCANFIPSRLTAAYISKSAILLGRGPQRVLRHAAANASVTRSPNSGWPMAAAAHALGCRLEKRGEYIINERGTTPDTESLRRARILTASAGVLGMISILRSRSVTQKTALHA